MENKTKAAQMQAVKRYQEGRDAIMLRPSKAEGHAIRQAAEDAGKSLQGYILEAVRLYMDPYINDDRQAGEHASEHPTP